MATNRSRLPGGIMGARPSWFANVVGTVLLLVMAFPIYWMVVTALKPKREILSPNPSFIPSPFTLDNFAKALSRDYFWSSVGNSLVVTIAVVLLSVVVGLAAALAIAWMPFRGRGNYIVAIILVQMIPLTALVIRAYHMVNQVHLTVKVVGVGLGYLA